MSRGFRGEDKWHGRRRIDAVIIIKIRCFWREWWWRGFAVLVRTRGNNIHVDLNGELSCVLCVGV